MSEPEAARAFGLLLFEAEESLARGHAEKALVMASRAVKERPDSLTALALYERARRDMLRGRRRERLEARIAEGRRLFERGHLEEAERIVTSALKLVPEHELAQYLHAQLKQRRLSATTPEAEAERELDRLARGYAQRAAKAARTALSSGWPRKALAEVRRGLRVCPDDPDLLAVLREVRHSEDRIERDTARRRAVLNRVRAAQDLLGQGRLEESLAILRGVLREEPDDARAQAAVQEVRRAWLRRSEQEERRRELSPRPAAAPPSRPAAPVAAPPDEEAARRREAARAAPPAGRTRTLTGVQARRSETVPAEILLPRTRRRATPLLLVIGGAAVAMAVVYLLAGPRRGPAPPPSPAPLALAGVPTPAPRPSAAGPLDGVVPELRAAIEATLADYARALETGDGELLARARPDLPASARRALLARFAGAINVATDLRVLDVVPQGAAAAVPVLRTDVIVGGNAPPTAPVEEVLRFERRGETWVLDAAGR